MLQRVLSLGAFDDTVDKWLSRSSSQGRLLLDFDSACEAILDLTWEGWRIDGMQLFERNGEQLLDGEAYRFTPNTECGDYTNRLLGRSYLEKLGEHYHRCKQDTSSLCVQLVASMKQSMGCLDSQFEFPVRSHAARIYAEQTLDRLINLFQLSRVEATNVMNERFRECGIGVINEDEFLANSDSNDKDVEDQPFDLIYRDSEMVTARIAYNLIVQRIDAEHPPQNMYELCPD